jgi:glucosamine-6-phosphate deaminase
MENIMEVHVAESRVELGRIAARDIGNALRAGLREKDHLRLILAAAPSQSEMLTALRCEPNIDWRRVTAFHMDEYIGLSKGAPQRFASWLKEEFVRHLPLARFEPIEPGDDPEAACRTYAALLMEAPIDLILLGIGANGHLAFNDPPADLEDPLPVKVVTLDQVCREQQVLDGCFTTLEDVPRRAITLTIPTLLSGRELFCCVPGIRKSVAVRATLESPISGECPATSLRTHPRCTLYLDTESNSMSQHHGRKNYYRA